MFGRNKARGKSNVLNHWLGSSNLSTYPSSSVVQLFFPEGDCRHPGSKASRFRAKIEGLEGLDILVSQPYFFNP